MRQINFQPLQVEQIEVRPTDTKTQGKCTLLLYIDSRSAAEILNNTVGVMNWQLEYKDVAGQIYGRLSIYDEERGIWVFKEDTGDESNISEKKGQSSDILKRCLARWGCDYLYHTPRIQVKCPDSYYFNGRMTMSFSVREIAFDGKNCTRLVIVDRFGNVVFNWSAKQTSAPKTVETNTSNNSDNALVPKKLYAQIVNAQSVDELKTIWDKNEEYHNNSNFKRIVGERKKKLAA